MTVRLRETLHEATDDLPGYPVYERALATARRARRRTAAASAAVVMLLAALVWTAPLQHIHNGPTGAASEVGSGALPDQIWVPVGALRVTDPFPLGAAAVVFTAPTSDGDETTVGVVAADGDRYRVLHFGWATGGGILSPDGTRLAYGVGTERIQVADLTDGSIQQLEAVDGNGWGGPLGWSPDGRQLVVVDAQRSLAGRTVLNLGNPDTGDMVHLITINGDSSLVHAVAFAPDGQQLALQIDGTVMITDLAGIPGPSFTVAPDEVLAGKGAWTPDGRGLTIAKLQGETSSLITIDPATGEVIDQPDLPAVSGVTAIRLLGWGPDGSPLVAAYQPCPIPADVKAPPKKPSRRIDGPVCGVRLLSLAPGATAPTVRMTTPRDVENVDVADELIATGRTRVADPPLILLGPRGWFWLVVGVALAAAFFGRLWYRTR